MKTRHISRRFGTAILMILALCMMTATAFATGEEAEAGGRLGLPGSLRSIFGIMCQKNGAGSIANLLGRGYY